ncbi:MAG: EAL domain-containing protein [bacterium]|nr:EAL domain-containing protein [bacterium]
MHVWKHAKKDKYKPYAIYSDDFANERQTRLKIIGSVHSAIENGEIEAFMQPKFSMKTMEVVGAEALSRWRNPDGSYKFPGQFIPLLEDVGYIIDVDFCIFEQVLCVMAKWKESGKKMIPVSVNFSRQHINHDDFVTRIKKLTAKYGVEPKYIEIEITESAFMKKPEKMMKFMRELREEGYKIDIDDFGTGYSSLNMLLDVPVDIVKIDKSFIDDYDTQTKREYINQIGNLIHTARKDIIFEGVETYDQIKFLTECGYENAQGYVFSKPIPMKEFEEKYIYI